LERGAILILVRRVVAMTALLKSSSEQDPSQENVSSCADLNAGAFHVLVANMLSRNIASGFVGDRDRGLQVWNQPIYKFVSQVSSTISSLPRIVW